MSTIVHEFICATCGSHLETATHEGNDMPFYFGIRIVVKLRPCKCCVNKKVTKKTKLAQIQEIINA